MMVSAYIFKKVLLAILFYFNLDFCVFYTCFFLIYKSWKAKLSIVFFFITSIYPFLVYLTRLRIKEELAREMMAIEKQKREQTREIEQLKQKILLRNVDVKILSEKILDMRVSWVVLGMR